MKLSHLLWDAFCLSSLVGIWPRFVEPNLLTKVELELRLPGLKQDLTLLVFSDLHFHSRTSDRFLRKLVEKAEKSQPDLIFFLGDFLCHSRLYSKEKLERFLSRFSPPLGAFAILGNHDYSEPVSVNAEGDYDVVDNDHEFQKAFGRLASNIRPSGKRTGRLKNIKESRELAEALKSTPFRLLHNQTHFLKKAHLNITGLGEYMTGHFKPEIAFKGYQSQAPGIVLVHNPDATPHLRQYPGQLILSGHTHGGQVNLPWVWKKLTLMENPQFKEGVFDLGDKTLFVSRGVGSVQPFRWYAPPEWVLLRLRAA